MAIYYLDVDDEITSAAQRIRESSENRVALVIQSGSRVASSRINFKLLAREARHRNRRLAIVAADASVRSMAEVAGLPVFGSVGEYQRTEAMRQADDAAGAAAELGGMSTRDSGSIRARGTMDSSAFAEALAAASEATGGATAAAAGAKGGAAGPAGAKGSPGARGSAMTAAGIAAAKAAPGAGKGSGAAAGRAGKAGKAQVNPPLAAGPRFGRWLVAGAVITLLTIVLSGFVLLPAATVVITVHPETVGPVTFNALVDPSVKSPSPETNVVPAVPQEFAVQAGGTFKATGENVLETAAIGKVTFSSGNTYLAVPIMAGTQVTTGGGVAFTTTEAVTVPKATLEGLNLVPGTADAGVVAVVKGTGGNVAAGAIVKVPPDLASALVLANPVTNKAATSGGTHTVSLFVQQADIDAAEAELRQQLETAFEARLADPAAAAAGVHLFAQGARLDEPAFDPDPKDLLGLEQERFDMTATGQGTALSATAISLRELAAAKVAGAARPGFELVEGSVTLSFGDSAAAGNAVEVAVTAQGLQVPVVDPARVRAAIGGMSVQDAEKYLSRYGTAEVSVWPFWVTTVPRILDFRVEVRVVVPTPAPAQSPLESATPGPSGPKASGMPEPTASATAGP